MMERMIGVYGDSVVRMLTTQYRMNSDIMTWSSNALYSGRYTPYFNTETENIMYNV